MEWNIDGALHDAAWLSEEARDGDEGEENESVCRQVEA
jgi:hypothetical protein